MAARTKVFVDIITSADKSGSLKKFAVGAGVATAALLVAAKAAKVWSDAASDADEIGSKFATVFRDMSREAESMADDFADSFGLADSTSRELLGTTADLLTGLGFTQEGAAELSLQVNTLAGDLASFSNFEGGTAKASEALTAALLGQSEQAKGLGIIINQNTQEYKDAIKFYTEVEGKTLLQAKAFTALQFATEQSGNAIGDVSRTWESHANVQKRLKESTKSLNEELGAIVNEGVTPMLVTIDSLVKGMANWLAKTNEANQFIREMAEGIDTSNRSLKELDLVVEAGAEAAERMSKGFGDSFTQALIDAGIEARTLADNIRLTTALELRYADAIAAGDSAKAAAAQFAIASGAAEETAIVRLEEIRIASLTTDERKLELIQAEINELSKFKDVPEVMQLINELAAERNDLRAISIDEEEELHNSIIKVSDATALAHAEGLIGIGRQAAALKDLELNWQSLTENGLGAFASTFKQIGEDGVTIWDTLKQAGKNAMSAILEGLAQEALVRAALALATPFGLGIPTAIAYTAAAATAFAASGLVQSFATGGSFTANEPTLIQVGESGQENVTVTPTSGSGGGIGGQDRIWIQVEESGGFWGLIQNGVDNRKFVSNTGDQI